MEMHKYIGMLEPRYCYPFFDYIQCTVGLENEEIHVITLLEIEINLLEVMILSALLALARTLVTKLKKIL